MLLLLLVLELWKIYDQTPMAKVIGERQDRQVAVNVKSGKEEEAKKKERGVVIGKSNWTRTDIVQLGMYNRTSN